MFSFILVLIVAVACLLFYVSRKPDRFRVVRNTHISAPPKKVFAHLNDFHRWEAWSPWEKMDANVKRFYEGSASGVGAKYRWEGNKDLGVGEMEITESMPYTRVGLKIHFIKPFDAQNEITFILTPDNGGTRLEHAMFGPQPFMAKLMSLFFNMEKMVGPKFEAGLADIKRLAEADNV